MHFVLRAIALATLLFALAVEKGSALPQKRQYWGGGPFGQGNILTGGGSGAQNMRVKRQYWGGGPVGQGNIFTGGGSGGYLPYMNGKRDVQSQYPTFWGGPAGYGNIFMGGGSGGYLPYMNGKRDLSLSERSTTSPVKCTLNADQSTLICQLDSSVIECPIAKPSAEARTLLSDKASTVRLTQLNIGSQRFVLYPPSTDIVTINTTQLPSKNKTATTVGDIHMLDLECFSKLIEAFPSIGKI